MLFKPQELSGIRCAALSWELLRNLIVKRTFGFNAMAGTKGLEPSASCVTGRRSNQLNYAPVELG